MSEKSEDSNADGSAPVSTERFNALESSIDNRFEEIKQLILALQPTTTTSTSPSPANTTSKALEGFVAASKEPQGTEGAGDGKNEEEKEEMDGQSTHNPKPKPTKGNGSGMYSGVPPPPEYPGPPLPQPHYSNVGNPPMLDASSFANWQFLMRSHLSSANTELWRIVEEGYYPIDPSNVTRREYADRQHNATALHMIQRSLTPKDLSHIRQFNIAKEAWDYLTALFIGNESIQASKFEEVSNECDSFVMNDDETPEEMYRRLKALSVAMLDLGATHTDDMWVKRKLIQALLPIDEVKCNTIKGRSDYRTMSSNVVLSEVVSMNSSKKIA